MDTRTKQSQNETKNKFEILPKDYKVNIEFNDLSYEVPDRKEGLKAILNNVNGEFRSNQLSAIMGTSGSGKTTLINLLAGFRIDKTSGTININKKQRSIKQFRKMSRYILQHDYVNPCFTVIESMLYAAKFKLEDKLSETQHIDEINEILEILHLKGQANTYVSNISGGEKKRLCIALELLNIPAVMFLDEPITGLDEFSATECIKLLKHLVTTGRTIICSIHSPSARLFEMFDKVFVLAEGECIYQGSTHNILPYLSKFGLNCPITYNPADFIIEVAAREYGDYNKKMVSEINNGKTYNWTAAIEGRSIQKHYLKSNGIDEFELEINLNLYPRTTSWLREYKLLFKQMLKQMWRDKTYIKFKILTKLFSVFCISLVYIGIGTDATKLIYNYHLAFLTSIMYAFLSMSPMLSHIPLDMNYLRREYFNQWYRLSSYFAALITAQIPDILILGFFSSATLYFATDQPMELYRFLLFLLVTFLTSLTSSSYGLALSSRLNMLNSLFLAPSIMSCWVIFANHSVGNPDMSTFEKTMMYSGYIRHSVEGLMAAMFGFNRPDSICPPEEVFCLLRKPRYLLTLVGYENLSYIHSIVYLLGFYVLFNTLAYLNFKCRLDHLKFLERNRYYRKIKQIMFNYIYLRFY